jgi:hypothetical protein
MERITKIMVSGQDNGSPAMLDRCRNLEMSKGVATLGFRTVQASRGSNVGLVWGQHPNGLPFRRGVITEKEFYEKMCFCASFFIAPTWDSNYCRYTE